MPQLAPGARQLPLRHISIRVPWHDTGWTGTVCKHPRDNIACLILPRIRETRKDDEEENHMGESFKELMERNVKLPPCVSERVQFMAPYEIKRTITHPYSETSNAHKHFLPTPFAFPAYAATCIPFRWMLKQFTPELVEGLELGFQPQLEEQAHTAMGFDTEFVQVKHNQLVMLDTFFGAIQPNQSLCFFYAKRTPLAEDTRRVVIGAGWVTGVGKSVEYLFKGNGPFESAIWERAVHHSIRPNFADGFLFPYHAVLEYLDAHPEADPSQYIAFVPDDQFWNFSYGSEHVTNDGAIAVLLSCVKAMQQIQQIVPGQWDGVLTWMDRRLNELWRMRGPYPGLGAALTAFGVTNGTLVAYELENQIQRERSDASDPWVLVEKLFTNPRSLSPSLQSKISDTLREKWKVLPAERRALLKLLSRFELNVEQATRYYRRSENELENCGLH